VAIGCVLIPNRCFVNHGSPSALPLFFGILWRQFRYKTFALTLFATGGIGLMGFEPILMRDFVDALRASNPEPAKIWTLFGMIAA